MKIICLLRKRVRWLSKATANINDVLSDSPGGVITSIAYHLIGDLCDRITRQLAPCLFYMQLTPNRSSFLFSLRKILWIELNLQIEFNCRCTWHFANLHIWCGLKFFSAIHPISAENWLWCLNTVEFKQLWHAIAPFKHICTPFSECARTEVCEWSSARAAHTSKNSRVACQHVIASKPFI